MPPANNRKRQKVFMHLGFALTNFSTTVYTTREQNQEKNFNAKVWNVSLENTTIWKIKSSTSSLDLCAPTKFAQIAVLVASKMKQKSSMTDGVHQNGATVKIVKRYQPVKNVCAVTKLRQLMPFI